MTSHAVTNQKWRLPVLTILILLMSVLVGGMFRSANSHLGSLSTSELRGITVKDLGEVEAGSHVDHTFELTCHGDHPIVITRIQTSCQCLAVIEKDLIGRTVDPGQTVTCSVGMQVPPVLKNHSASAVVEYTSNGKVKNQALKVMCSVVADYALSVTELDLGELNDTSFEREFKVELKQLRDSQKPVEIQQIDCDSAEVTIRLNSPVRYTIKYVHSDFDRAAKINVPIIVVTTSAVLPRSVIQLHGSFRPAVTIEPDSIFIGSTERRESFVVPIRVRTTRNASVNVDASDCNFCEVLMNDSAESGLENMVEVKLTPPSAGAGAILTLTISYEDGRKSVKRVSVVRF